MVTTAKSVTAPRAGKLALASARRYGRYSQAQSSGRICPEPGRTEAGQNKREETTMTKEIVKAPRTKSRRQFL
ncbi:MAG: hypothetical protein KIT20_13720, partial [Alphaproteobacteria bacterium]|nr:hypothetical protein [Alphaproteobacteria bacterium]